MKIPSSRSARDDMLRYVIDVCMASSEDRRSAYARRRNYFLYGQDQEIKVKCNRLKSHMKLVASFLFSPDCLIYNIAPPSNADEYSVKQFLALQDDWNEDVRDSGLADTFAEAVMWALNFDTAIVKIGWNDIKKQISTKLVEPCDFGVFREDDPDFDNQPAMNHRFVLDYDEACARLAKAGHSDKIPSLLADGEQGGSSMPAALRNIIAFAVNGTGVNETITGAAGMNYSRPPQFRARLTSPMVSFDETWIWDSEAEDYRIFHSVNGGTVVLSDSSATVAAIAKAGKHAVKYNSPTNWFLEKQVPFVPVTPFTLYNYFWGDAHMEDIIPLQDWSEKRLAEIDQTLEAQCDPLRVWHGGQGLLDEKQDLDYGAFYADDNPSSSVQEMRPPMPEDLFREFNEIGGLMMEASGLTEVVSGKSSGGARGGQQQKQMQITGGGQIRKTAIGLETALTCIGDIGLRLKMKNDDAPIRLEDGAEFVAAQCPDSFIIRVDGHSHSPLFTLESRELAVMLLKAQAIDREWFIRMVNPTQKHNLVHSLRLREKAEAQAQQQRALTGEADAHKRKK